MKYNLQIGIICEYYNEVCYLFVLTGFYRVNYDTKNWDLLVKGYEKLPRLSKMQLINDGFNLAIAGQLSYDVPLSIVEKLRDENDILLWNVTTNELQNIIFLLNKTPLLDSFKVIYNNIFY